MDFKSNNELLQSYYQSVLLLQNEQDIINALPEPTYVIFLEIISGLIKILDKEIQKTKLLTLHENNEEMKEYMNEEIKTLTFKKNICQQLQQEAEQTQKLEEENIQKKNLIFATTNYGNIYIEDDMKNLAEEYYESVIESLLQLESGEKVKDKRLISNAKLAKIHELKPFKVRICYKILSEDCVYIMIVKSKKSNNDKKDVEEIIDRNQKTEVEFAKLKKDLKDPLKKQQIIEENKFIQDKIFQYINSNKRGNV